MTKKGLHTIVNDVMETDEGIKYVRNLNETAFPETLNSWNLEVLNARDLRIRLFENLKKYVDIHGIFDLILCLTTGGVRFFYAYPINNYGKHIAVLPYSTTHGTRTKQTADVLLKELYRIECDNPKILILDGEVSIFGYTEKNWKI